MHIFLQSVTIDSLYVDMASSSGRASGGGGGSLSRASSSSSLRGGGGGGHDLGDLHPSHANNSDDEDSDGRSATSLSYKERRREAHTQVQMISF